MANNETTLIDTWLYGVLHGDATLLAAAPGDVHTDMAPPGTAYPLVIFALQDGDDFMTLNGVRIWLRATYQVKVIGEGESYVALATAAARIDTLLHLASGTPTGGRVYSCVRVEPVRYPEVSEGKSFRHLGGLYEITVQSA